MSDAASFFVAGAPAPQGSKKAFVVGRRAHLVESAGDKLVSWREAVRSAAQDVPTRFPRDTPLTVTLDFVLRLPASAPKLMPSWPTKRPDIDKLVRATLDALVMAGTIADDAQVVDLHATKVYSGEDLAVPGCGVAVEPEWVWAHSRHGGAA